MPCAASHWAASLRSRLRFALPTASSGVPNRVPDRVFTSQTTNVCRSTATMSISPSADRQFRSRIRNPQPSR